MTKAAEPTTTTVTGNPIRPIGTADPGVVLTGGKWYVCHTGSYGDGHYPIAVSDDLTSWARAGFIFPPGKGPKWAQNTRSWWAPEVHRVNDNYIAYFTTREDSTNTFVVGAALSDVPEGPFTDVGAPIVRTEGVGLIDVTYFQDPKTSKQYLVWKEDRNDFVPQEPTPLIMQEVTSSGLELIGQPKELLRNDREWEAMLVEAPTIVYREGWYYLFYSGNMFSVDEYAVGVARSRDVWGPYEKYPEPILSHDEHFSGPGHQFVIQDKKGVWHMFYHARLKSLDSSARYLMHDLITFGPDGWPKVNDGHPGPLAKDVVEQIRDVRGKWEKRQIDNPDPE